MHILATMPKKHTRGRRIEEKKVPFKVRGEVKGLPILRKGASSHTVTSGGVTDNQEDIARSFVHCHNT